MSKMTMPIAMDLELNLSDIENIVGGRIAKEVQKNLINGYYYHTDGLSEPFKAMLKESLDTFMSENRDLIMDRVIENITQRLSKTKELKEKLSIVIENY